MRSRGREVSPDDSPPEVTLLPHPPSGEGGDGAGRLSPRARAIVAALAVTQTVGYGSLYYSFAVFLTPVTADLGASRTAVTGAFTTAVLASALLAVPVGRWLDRRGARGLMAWGSVAGTLLLVALAHVHSLAALYLVWAGIGTAGAMVFYEAAFATVIAWSPPSRRGTTLLAVTVVAGFASSIFLPLTGLLVDRFGWRTAALILAGLHGVVTVPLHALVLRRPPDLIRHPDQGHERDRRRATAVRSAVRDVRYWLLAVAFTAQHAAIATMTLHLIGFLVTAGHPATLAATISGLLGVLSVTGRLVVTGLNRRFPTTGVVAAVFTVQALAAALLPVVAADTRAAVVGVVYFGIGFGIANIARPALLADAFGSAGYATLSGILAVPITVATATAPLGTAALQHATASYTPVLLVVAACNLTAAAAVLLTARRPARR